MNPIRNILVIVDPTAQEHPAVEKGAALAEKFASRLELFLCDTKAARNAREAAYAREPGQPPSQTDFKALLESLAAPLRARGLDVTTEAVSADPLHTALVDRVKRTSAELVIKDTHHHTLVRRTFLGNTDWELIRGCPVPLLLTKAKRWPTAPVFCAAVDPGHHDDKPVLLDRCILDQSSAFAQRLGGEVHVVHAYIPMAIVAATSGTMPPMVVDVSPSMLAAERDAKLKELTALVSDYQVPAANLHLEVGGAGEVLCRLAVELDADVMAMGAVSRSALKRIFIGSTAEAVLEHLPCDLLIVKSPNFAELLLF